ncbi:MAG: glycosyltransferase [Deltaproteobacteria bacterium]|nr:glycosyltransferase [Deltaproteobacteria bacterium]
MNKVLLIPAYNPEEKIVALIKEIPKGIFDQILIINDGSSLKYSDIFNKLSMVEDVKILTHESNQGKGAALKTGFLYVLKNIRNCMGVVTADADGQHLKKDILAIADSLKPARQHLILGSRAFNSEQVPFRSRFGNKLTRMVMRFFFKIDLKDTQSGLRAIPCELLPQLLSIPFNRYEFEIEMLLIAEKNGYAFKEIEVDTVYENNNMTSSFNPVIDSVKIYFVLFRYIIASLMTASVDYIVFFISYSFLPEIFLCTYFARFIALFVNFIVLKKYVFHLKENNTIVGLKYLLIVIISGFLSSITIEYFNHVLNLNIFLSKISAELLLYFGIFLVQKEFVFRLKGR